MKTCSKCLQKKVNSAFHFRHANPKQLQSWCKECVLHLNRKKYADNPALRLKECKALYHRDKVAIACRRRMRRIKNLGGIRKHTRQLKVKKKENEKARPDRVKNKYLKDNYGISLEQFDEMILNQGGLCLICVTESRLCVDHDHKTGKVRGLLCPKCNQALGLLKDSSSSARRAAVYLERP